MKVFIHLDFSQQVYVMKYALEQAKKVHRKEE